jgi:hypothetical protein
VSHKKFVLFLRRTKKVFLFPNYNRLNLCLLNLVLKVISLEPFKDLYLFKVYQQVYIMSINKNNETTLFYKLPNYIKTQHVKLVYRVELHNNFTEKTYFKYT